MNINLLTDNIPLADSNSSCPRRRHHGEEFTPLAVSFVERDGFVTITDESRFKAMKLPRWQPSPMWYRVNNNGSVWGRHFTQDRLHKVSDSVEEWKKDYLRNQEQFLIRNGCTFKDVYN